MLLRFSKGGFRQLAVRYLKDCMCVSGKGQSECMSQILYMHLFFSPEPLFGNYS